MPKIIRVIIILISLLLTTILGIQTASALVAEDILVIYNENLPASKEVAEHYISKRNVPPANLLGLDLPDSESISAKDFEKQLPIIQKALLTLKKTSRNPAILLVFGVPLKTGVHKLSRSSEQKELIEQKIKELSAIVASLTNKLNQLTGTSVNIPKSDISDTVNVLQDAQKSVAAVGEFLNKAKQSTHLSESSNEVGSLTLRLVGISPLAKQVLRHAESAGEEGRTSIKNNSLLNIAFTLDEDVGKILFRGLTDQNALEMASLIRTSQGLIGELNFWYTLKELDPADKSSASVDSELCMLFAEPYQKARWLPNPFLKQFDNVPGINHLRETTIKVCRLDAPTPELAKRLVDDAVWAEANGLKGTFYIDARGRSGGKKDDAYTQYDERLRILHMLLKEKSSMPVVLDNKEALFSENSCPDAALYCGWYSLGKYVDSFKWQRGAVGFHIASSEAATLKKAGSQVWCKRMIEEGVAATLGPVEEPYLNSFPLPDVFFPLLMSGELTLLDVYYQSTPFVSWRQTLIGDPLYNPFKKQPAITPENKDTPLIKLH